MGKMASVAIKGTRDGLLVTLGEGELADLLAELGERLGSTASFFKGGRVALQVGARELSIEELERIRDLLAQNEVELHAVVSDAARTRAAARSLGLEASAGVSRGVRVKPGEEFGQAVLIRRTLRSGQVIQHPGHVVIIGDVNPGAEVIAGGDIVIWGRLRGTAHAGAMGDEGAVVCTLDLAPTQLRIAGYIARPPEGKRRGPALPEVARVKDGRIVVEPWK